MATDVNPNAEPIKLASNSGLDPNQHDPNKEGSFLERQVNKNYNKVMNIAGAVDSVIAGALFGAGVGVAVFAGYKLIQHLLNRWDVNIFKLFTDPFGFFGGSAFRSTRYFHYFNQYSQEQAEFLPDPISTYAGSAVASNEDIGSYVVNAIQNGKGNKLKRYYQYSTLRFANRNWDWRLDRAKDVDRSNLKINNNLLSSVMATPKRFEIVHQDTQFVPYGSSYLKWVQDNYGLDEFHRDYNGKKYDVLQPPVKQADGQWAIAQSETDDTDFILVPSIPVKPSKGLTYWTNSEAPKNLEVQKDYVREFLQLKDLPKNYPNDKRDIGKLTWIEERYYWTNPYSKKADESGNNPNPEPNTNNPTLSGGLLYSKFVTLVAIHQRERTVGRYASRVEKYEEYEFQVTMVVSYVGYDREQFIYVEEDGNTNNSAVAKLYNVEPPKQTIKPVIASNTSRAFKFYPYIPLREWTKGRHAGYRDLPIVPKEFTDAVKELNKLAQEDDIENSEANVDKNKKRVNKHEREEKKKKTSDGKTVKAKQRKIQRGLSSKRKVKARQIWNMKKPMSDSTLKRHINQMAKLLSLDFEYEAVNFTASNYYNGGIYNGGHYVSQLLMPAVNFATNNKETHRYLYTFFNRIYHMYGGDEQVKNWYATVQNATSLSDISINKLEWVNQSTMDYGGMSWLFINKFKMTGNVRKLRRNHRYFDILRGKPVTIKSITELQALVEPLRELSDDKHYKSKNGIEYCIGGQGYNGSGIYNDGNSVYEAFNNFDYTFFARQSGENEISVIAVAGLSFTTKLSELTRWCRAFHDLDLHFQRNREKYIEKKANPSASDEISRKESKKHYHYNVITHWGIIPLDYRTLCRMGGTELERFAQRSILHYGFIKSEQKGKRKGLKPVMTVAQIVLFIVSVILALPSGGTSLSLSVVAQAIVQAIVVTVVTSLAVKFLLLPLLKAIGLKAFIILIVLIVAAIALGASGGTPPPNQSVLPYADEVAKQTVSQISTQVAKETTTQTLSQTLKTALVQGVKEAFNTGFKLISTVASATNQTLSQYNQQNAAELQSAIAKEQEAYNKASSDLREMQEELDLHKPNFNVQEVMANLRLRFKMVEPNNFIASNTTPDEFSASYEYLENFINMKLDLNPETFDPVRSLDFSFKNSYTSII